MKSIFISGLLAAALTGGSAFEAGALEAKAETAPVIYATAWGYTLAQDGSGFYNDVAAALTKREEGRSFYKLMPYKRAKAKFLADAGGCLFPSSVDVLKAGGLADEKHPMVQTEPLFEARTHLFAAPGEEPPHTMADLKGKRIALPAGSMMMDLLKGSGAKIIGVNDEESKAEMLMSGRVQVMSGMMPDTGLVFAHMGRQLPAFDGRFSFLNVGLAVVCRKTPETEALIGRLNSRIAELETDAAYRDMLHRAGVKPVGAGAEAMNAIMPAGGADRLLPAPAGRRFPHLKLR
ncbi:substrate-binding periplasmic protein [Kordiimonas marina]|uniref:substrate-binding periplasmic protein n=1 Tax=Kordiimonas marina TaxID=2872312 RepID=UPI001FF3944F|nr:transporter substrate-binding domain-containing protein [Kordiimonas marina]MCJ9428660.1 transporter substrate-binding domain-containing protein [Kordiimonas marina]